MLASLVKRLTVYGYGNLILICCLLVHSTIYSMFLYFAMCWS
uniref:Uncharacterized protein n=1 Tax=Anguilla anguilla TaxID=7936 RepID=A0A0E9VD88_ANGAN